MGTWHTKERAGAIAGFLVCTVVLFNPEGCVLIELYEQVAADTY
jgi:hypothetical protein